MYAYFIFNAYPMTTTTPTKVLRLLNALSWIYFPLHSLHNQSFSTSDLGPPIPSPPSGSCACQTMTMSSQTTSVVFPDVGFY